MKLALDRRIPRSNSSVSATEKTLDGLGSLLKNLPTAIIFAQTALRQSQQCHLTVGIHEMLFIPDSPMQLSRFVAELIPESSFLH
jgi:hypothetical protein